MVLVDDEHVGDGALQEGPVVAHHDEGAGPVVEEVLQHPQRVEVEVVGRLVEQQHVGLGPQREQQLEPAPLAARQQPIGARWASASNQNASSRRASVQSGSRCAPATAWRDPHRRVEVDSPLVADGELDGAPPHDPPLGRGQPTGDDVEQRGLAGAVGPDDAQPLPGVEGQVDVAEQPGLAVAAAVADAVQLDHLVAQARGLDVERQVVAGRAAASGLASTSAVADSIRGLGLLVRAGAPRRSQASSLRARLRRTRSAAAACSSRSARASR